MSRRTRRSNLLVKLARQNGLDAEALTSSLRTGEFRERVKNDFRGGVRSGLNGTPTFFIDGQRHDAPPDYESLAGAVAEIIS